MDAAAAAARVIFIFVFVFGASTHKHSYNTCNGLFGWHPLKKRQVIGKMSFLVVASIRKETETDVFSTSLSNRIQHPKERKERKLSSQIQCNPGGAYDGDVSLPFVITTPPPPPQPPSSKSITIKNDAYIIHSKLVERILCQNKQQQQQHTKKERGKTIIRPMNDLKHLDTCMW